MKCQDLRRYLEPWLDDELSLETQLTILPHLENCSHCRALFESETRIRSRLQDALSAEVAPQRLRARIHSSLDARGVQALEPRIRFWPAARRTLVVGATAALVFFGTIHFESARDPSAPEASAAQSPVIPPLRPRKTLQHQLETLPASTREAPRERLLDFLWRSHVSDLAIANALLGADGANDAGLLATRFEAHDWLRPWIEGLDGQDLRVFRSNPLDLDRLALCTLERLTTTAGLHFTLQQSGETEFLCVAAEGEVFVVLAKAARSLLSFFERLEGR